ncbi:thioredoxin family protein [Flavobacterium silvaticum]|uniref:Thioredoxin family protein n=1 Tax=Flavobacterium silvaticum TaxID=1852020 RepID=A0A972FLB0_9FLAO|nr:thioredoxin family protein [Flavobacterium silvaticum]NMH27813.1 thioredoxin family protein [Flavobacterium silvaticum]
MRSLRLLLLVLLVGFCADSAFSQQWSTDFASASAEAKAQNKNILLVFSGSDWCAPCIKLDKNIWQSEAFKADSENWILVKADFPKKKSNALSPELTQQNAGLCDKYNLEGNFPLVVILTPEGKVLGKTAYKEVSPEAYISQLHAFVK